MFHQWSRLARMAECRSVVQTSTCSWQNSPAKLQGNATVGPCLLSDHKWLQKSQVPIFWLPRAPGPSCPHLTACHTWFPLGARIKYPSHYVHSVPGGDWNKKLLWQKSLGNETQGRWGKRRKIEIKNKKKALNQVDGMSPELLTASELGEKKRRKWTPGHIVRLKVYLVCVS